MKKTEKRNYNIYNSFNNFTLNAENKKALVIKNFNLFVKLLSKYTKSDEFIFNKFRKVSVC